MRAMPEESHGFFHCVQDDTDIIYFFQQLTIAAIQGILFNDLIL